MRTRTNPISYLAVASVILAAAWSLLDPIHQPVPTLAVEAVSEAAPNGAGAAADIVTIEQRERALGLRGDI